MNTISLISASSIDSLRTSLDLLNEGLQSNHILAYSPTKNSLEIRVSTLWEKFCIFIRFKPKNIRLKTIQPLIFNFIKDNDELLSSDPTLYPKILKIYLSSIYPEGQQRPLCLKKNSRLPAPKPLELTLEQPNLTVSIASDTPPQKTYLLSSDPYNNRRKIITIPYKLLMHGPDECLKSLKNISSQKLEKPEGLYLHTETLFQAAWDKHFDCSYPQKDSLIELMRCIDQDRFNSMNRGETPSSQTQPVIDFEKLIRLINQLSEFYLEVISLEDLNYLKSTSDVLNIEEPHFLASYIISNHLTQKKPQIPQLEEEDAFSAETWELLITYFEGRPPPSQLSADRLLDTAKLAAQFKHEKLTKHLTSLVANGLTKENLKTLFPKLINFILSDDMSPYVEVPDQEIVSHLILRAREVSSYEKTFFSDFLKEDTNDQSWLKNYLLAKCYEYGIGLNQDFEKAIQLYQTLADQNNSWAQFEIGKWHHYSGNNFKEALAWYEKSGKQGFIPALYYKACILSGANKSTPYDLKDIPKALELCEQLANQGERLGLYGLADLYENGIGVAKSVSKALKLYQLASDKQEPKSWHALAKIYETGIGAPKDLGKAFKLYLLAAKQGLQDSQLKVADCFEKGIGTTQDSSKKNEWVTKYNQKTTDANTSQSKYSAIVSNLKKRVRAQTTPSS